MFVVSFSSPLLYICASMRFKYTKAVSEFIQTIAVLFLGCIFICFTNVCVRSFVEVFQLYVLPLLSVFAVAIALALALALALAQNVVVPHFR